MAGAPFQAPTIDLSGTGATKTARRIGCSLVPVIVGMVIIGFVISAVRSCDISTTSSSFHGPTFNSSSMLTLSGGATVLPGDGPEADLVVITQETKDSTTTRRIARVSFTKDGSKLVWQSEPVDDSAYRAEVAVVGNTLFAGIDDNLYALDAKTGKTQWRATLHDKVTTGCPSCFSAVGDRLVVRTTDAFVSGYGTASSESLWTKRLNSTSGSISVVGDRLFVVDDPEDASQLTTATLTDPTNGKAVRTVTPRCPKSDSNPYDVEMDAGDAVHAIPGGADVVAAFGFGDACVVRWNPGTGAIRWTSRLTGMSTIDQDSVLIGTQDLVVSNTSNQLVAVSLTKGTAEQLKVPNDLQATANQIVGRTLVANTKTGRGTPRNGLMAWDLGSAQQLWAQSTLGATQPVSESAYHSSDALFDGSPRSLLVPVGQGLNLFTFEGTQHTFTVAPLDLRTGDLGTPVRRAYLTAYESGTPSLAIEGQQDPRLFVTIDTLLQAIPVSGHGDVVPFPEPN